MLPVTVNLYSIAADKRVLDKITGVLPVNTTPITVKPTEGVNAVNPVFIMDYDAAYMNVNYLYCDTFDRYYYVQPPTVNTAGRIELQCIVDVRQSFKASLLKVQATVIRAQSKGQPTKYPDNKLPVYPNKKNVTSIEMPENNNRLRTLQLQVLDYGYLLTVVGGEPSI